MFMFRRRANTRARTNRKGDRPRGGAGEMEPVFRSSVSDRASQGRVGLAVSCSKEERIFHRRRNALMRRAAESIFDLECSFRASRRIFPPRDKPRLRPTRSASLSSRIRRIIEIKLSILPYMLSDKFSILIHLTYVVEGRTFASPISRGPLVRTIVGRSRIYRAFAAVLGILKIK